ncbi:ATP-binding protein [Flavobacteriaceae bacterium S356]|uniref:histidine kinase n=1 Tax=Asprobacillus argus TaxID=3076534 RepID=A0ABU3LDR7_9FLAO|nr:ATP-binding protein [Flavobacteriaceae bacterium S356]
MKTKPFYKSALFLLLSFFLMTSSLFAQEISQDNYKEKYKEAVGFIRKENLEKGSNLTYKLIDYLRENRDIYADSTDILLSKNYWNLTNLYLWKNQELSLKYADSTITIALRTNSPGIKQRAYSIKYYCLYDVKGYEKTLDFLANECIKYSLLANNNKMLGESYMHKCNSMVMLGKASEATSFCNQAVDVFKNVNDEGYLASVYNNIGNVFTKKKETRRALEFYEKSHEIALRIQPAIEISKSARNIAEKNEELRNFKKAATFYKTYGDSLESHMNKVIDSKFAEAESKYQVEQKDKEIAQQELEIEQQKNTRNLYIIISLIIFIVVFIYLQKRFNKQKRQKLIIENSLEKEQEINVMRAKFLGNISHEIRTPLTLISGNIQMALEEIGENKKLKEHLDNALLNSKKVIDDANEILHILKFDKSKQEVYYRSVSIVKFSKRIFLSFESAAKAKEITLEYKTNVTSEVEVQIDSDKVERILNNLITNAIKFSSSTSSIICSLALTDDQLEISIQDFGIGISIEEKNKVFERFYQSKTSKSVGGIGIGLALSKEFAELMNGDITVSSTLNKGSSFTLKLPYIQTTSKANPQESTVITHPSKQDVDRTIKAAKILIVEDNVEMNNFLKDIFKDMYDCSVAFDGKEAYDRILKEDFDLITSDVMMPRVDGFELRELLNQIPEKKDIPFILITAKSLEVDKLKGFQLGINDYIIKPFNKNELLARVRNLIENNKVKKEWHAKHQDLFEKDASFDVKLLEKVQKIVASNIMNEDFKVDVIAKEIGYSQRQLSRLLKQYTGMSPVKFILEIRLQKAYQLLKDKTHKTLAEVKYNIGISSTPYFNSKFKQRFGVKPSEFIDKE